MTNSKELLTTSARLSWFEKIEQSTTVCFDFGTSIANPDRVSFCVSVHQMRNFNQIRSQMISRKKVINLFINYYINEDRNNVRSLLNTHASSSDFLDDLSALNKSFDIDIKLVKKKEENGSIHALQKRQGYVMKERIDAINERLNLGGHSLLTESEIHLIYKNWPSIHQLVRESIEENSGSGDKISSTSVSATLEFLQ